MGVINVLTSAYECYQHVVFCRKADADASVPSPSTKILYQRLRTPVRHGNLEQIHPPLPSDQHLGRSPLEVCEARAKALDFPSGTPHLCIFPSITGLTANLRPGCLCLGWWGAGGILNAHNHYSFIPSIPTKGQLFCCSIVVQNWNVASNWVCFGFCLKRCGSVYGSVCLRATILTITYIP